MAPALHAIGQVLAQQLDVELMDPTRGAYSLSQLMELAGLSVAQSIAHAFPTSRAVVVVVGPGNNGGDGLVAARHLALFGWRPIVYTPRRSRAPYVAALYAQLRALDVPTLFESSSDAEADATTGVDSILDADTIKASIATQNDLAHHLATADVVIDALFGFSFRGPVRAPFDAAIEAVNACSAPIVAVDMPSGWDVELGPIKGQCCVRNPDVLVSLTIPKRGAQYLSHESRHFVGGRFVPNRFARRHRLTIPQYPGYQQFVDITGIRLDADVPSDTTEHRL